MNEGDFDKKISEKLKDDHRNYPDLDKNWQKVVKKLAENQASKPTTGGLVVLPNEGAHQKSTLVPWLLVALLLLLGSNAWFVWHLYEANNSPKSALLDNNTRSQTPDAVRLYDTIIETKVIYKVDTIYKTVVVQETLSNQNNTTFGLNNKDNYSTNPKTPPSVFSPNLETKQIQLETPTEQKLNKNTPNNTDIKQTTETITTTKEANRDKNTGSNNTTIAHTLPNSSEQDKETGEQSHLPITATNVLLNPHTDSLNDKSNKLNQTKNDSMKQTVVPYDSLELKPQQALNEHIIIKPSRKKWTLDHYGIGLQGGFSSEFPNLKDVKQGNWIGLTGEVALNKQLRLSVSGDYMSTSYKTLTRNPLLELPNDPPMTENYNLKYIEGSPMSLLANMSITYFLKPKSKYNPFLSVGYTYRWIIPYTVEFEFINKLTNEEKSFKIENYHHNDRWFILGAGVETALSSKVFGQLKAEYIYDSNHGNKELNYLLLRGAILYRF